MNVSAIQSADKAQSNDWNFNVYQEQLVTKQGKNSGIFAVCRQDNGEVIGQYKGFKALNYPSLVETFETALQNAQLTVASKKLFTTGNGARFFGSYEVGEMNVRGEAFGMSVRLQSSHDGSLIPAFAFEGKRLACLNKVMANILYAMFSQKHSVNFDLSFIADNVHIALEKGKNHIAQFVEKMAQIAISDADAKNILSNIVALGAGAGVSERAGYLIHHNWMNPSHDEQGLGNTLYRLYNAATRFTRDVENVGRFELSRRANIYITGAFDLAASREHDLRTLLAIPQKALDWNGVTVDLS